MRLFKFKVVKEGPTVRDSHQYDAPFFVLDFSNFSWDRYLPMVHTYVRYDTLKGIVSIIAGNSGQQIKWLKGNMKTRSASWCAMIAFGLALRYVFLSFLFFLLPYDSTASVDDSTNTTFFLWAKYLRTILLPNILDCFPIWLFSICLPRNSMTILCKRCLEVPAMNPC